MALQSHLFSGDPKLEACALQDSAHVALGAVGEHVAKIQTALISLDGADIDSTELAGARYGQSTAAAVLKYKQKRKIINPTYQTQPDNIVGKMTIVALDGEMAEFEKRIDSRGVCHCRAFPRAAHGQGGRGPRLAFSVSAPSVGVALTGTPREQALARLPLAKLWVARARTFITLGKAQILSGLPPASFDTTEERKALVTHFKIDHAPDPFAHLTLLEGVYILIARTFAVANTVFIDDPSTRDFGNAHLNGFAHQSDPVLGRIRFGPNYAGKGELFQTSVLVHEGAHFVNRSIDHFASELPAPNGTPVNSSTGIVHSKNYAQLNFQEAAGNAYTYAQFALHAFKGFDKRIVPFNE